MNQKASVSKELNARHSKILEFLLKLPENRECADCQSRGPRWASVNLGIFICMQCSGIHRSLGVHISQVRSITLDTWLPEQVAFMQSMGNEKSNKYWEGELPPEESRRKIETFIRAKYNEKRWVPKGATKPIPIPADKTDSNRLTQGEAKNGIPRRTRNFSLEEKILTQHVAQITPPPERSRKGSLDMNREFLGSTAPKLSPIMTEFNTPNKKTNTATDHYSMIYTSNESQDRSSVTPSRWATFDCESRKLHNEFTLVSVEEQNPLNIRLGN